MNNHEIEIYIEQAKILTTTEILRRAGLLFLSGYVEAYKDIVRLSIDE